MSESRNDDAAAGGAPDSMATAGAMLRSAREKRGLHIAALAASIKVPQRKLEALESDRYEELLDLTFTRALAQTVCRSLKIDAQPVLERLPLPEGSSPKLAHVSTGLNAPFRERPGQDEPADWSWLGRPVVWGTLLVLIAAALVAWMPLKMFEQLRGLVLPSAAPGAASAPAASMPTSMAPAAPAASAIVEVLPSTPTPAALPAEAATATATSLGAPEGVEAPVAASAVNVPVATALLAVKVSGESWIEVQDARGQTLVSRRVTTGEAIGLDGAVPLRVTVGNASATQLTFRGQPVDLSANTVANVARLQLN
jgi:cytoskeleton protein RodZ